MKLKGLSYPYLLWMALFIVLPLALVVYYAVTTTGEFTLEHFARLLQPNYLRIFGRSLWLALISTAICLVLAYPAAYILASRQMKRASLILVLILLPMWMNFLLRTYSWEIILEEQGVLWHVLRFLGVDNPPQMIKTQGAVVLGMVYNFLPFMVLPIYTALNKMDHHLIEAAKDLGAGPVKVFRRVVLPLSMPGVISGIVMVFMPAASTFVISQRLGGGKVMLLGDLVEQQFTQVHNWNFGSAISIVLMLVILLSMGLVNGSSEANLDDKPSAGRKRRAVR